jgi:scyllo-inositol 2-dehydrogenase (NADP+)
MLADENVDAILVSSPTSMHFEHAGLAIEAGKHVMIEKPMALNAHEAVQLIERARVRGVTLSVFHNRRWDLDFLLARELLASGILGRVFNVESRLGQFASCVGPAAREWNPEWRNEGSYGGGALYDWGSHFMDQLWQLLLPAKPVRVFAQLRGNVWSVDCDDFARVMIDFDSGACALVEINTTTRRPLPRWHIDGTAASATAPQSPDFDTNLWARFEIAGAEGKIGSHDLPQLRATAIRRQKSESTIWREFVDACQGRGDVPVTPDSALVTMRILDAAKESARTGKTIELNA